MTFPQNSRRAVAKFSEVYQIDEFALTHGHSNQPQARSRVTCRYLPHLIAVDAKGGGMIAMWHDQTVVDHGGVDKKGLTKRAESPLFYTYANVTFW